MESFLSQMVLYMKIDTHPVFVFVAGEDHRDDTAAQQSSARKTGRASETGEQVQENAPN